MKLLYDNTITVENRGQNADMGNTQLFYFFIFVEIPYIKFILQSSDAPENYGFTRWVDPAPIDSVQEFIEYLQIKIFERG